MMDENVLRMSVEERVKLEFGYSFESWRDDTFGKDYLDRIQFKKKENKC